MKTDQFGQMICTEADLIDLIMTGQSQVLYNSLLVDQCPDMQLAHEVLESVPVFEPYHSSPQTLSEFDQQQQQQWFMPEQYQQMDIAEWVLAQCVSDAELQRCGQELLMYQERGLFDLLRYLKYLTDTMKQNNIIWGVGRGSSVSSFVLYKIGVHRINSLFYELDPAEFLR
jgi:DNA polymerase III alpha subunit